MQGTTASHRKTAKRRPARTGSVRKRGLAFTVRTGDTWEARWTATDEAGNVTQRHAVGFESQRAARERLRTETGRETESFTFAVYWFTTDEGTGKRTQHSKSGFRQESEASEFLTAQIAKVDAGSFVADRALTVKSLLRDHWLPTQRSRELRPATLDLYQLAVESWLVPTLGALRVSALTPRHVQDLIEHLRTATSARGKPGLSPRSRQIAVVILKRATPWARANRLIPRDPLAAMKRPNAALPEMKCWTTDEARRFLEGHPRGPSRRRVGSSAHPRDPAWRTGGLRWDALDLEHGRAQIVRTRIVVDGKVLDSAPKTKAGRRTVPLDDRLVALLQVHERRQKWSGSRPVRPTKIRDTSSPTRSVGRTTPTRTRHSLTGSSRSTACRGSVCTTAGTRQRRCCSPRACPSRSSPIFSGTHRRS